MRKRLIFFGWLLLITACNADSNSSQVSIASQGACATAPRLERCDDVVASVEPLTSVQYPQGIVQGDQYAKFDQPYAEGVRRAAAIAIRDLWLSSSVDEHTVEATLLKMRCAYIAAVDSRQDMVHVYRPFRYQFAQTPSILNAEAEEPAVSRVLESLIHRDSGMRLGKELLNDLFSDVISFRKQDTRYFLLPKQLPVEITSSSLPRLRMRVEDPNNIDPKPAALIAMDLFHLQPTPETHRAMLVESARIIEEIKILYRDRWNSLHSLGHSQRTIEIEQEDALNLIGRFAYLIADWVPWGGLNGNWGVLYILIAEARRLAHGNIDASAPNIEIAMKQLLTSPQPMVDRPSEGLDLLLMLGPHTLDEALPIYKSWHRGNFRRLFYDPINQVLWRHSDPNN